MRKPRYRWSHLYQAWMLQSAWAKLAPSQVWPSTLMPAFDARIMLYRSYERTGERYDA